MRNVTETSLAASALTPPTPLTPLLFFAFFPVKLCVPG
jgi:hypothetical protein